MKIPHKKISTAILSLAIFVLPVAVYGASLIPCGDNVINGVVTNPCGFNDIITLANRVIHFLMIDVAVPLAAIGFMFSGAKLVLNQDKEGAWSEAKESFWNILMGFGIMLGAYVLIKVILLAFLNTDAGFTLNYLLQ